MPPSFSSFPPSFSSFPDLPSQQASTSSSRSKRTEKEKDRGKKRSKRSHNDDASKDQITASEVHPQIVEVEQRFYYSDRKGDPMNIQYGGLHAGDIPRYRIVGGGRDVLGLSKAWIALRRSGKGVEIGVRGPRKMASLTDSTSRALLAAPPTRRLLPSKDSSKYEEHDGFIRLPSRRERRNQDPAYRSITAAEDHDSADSDSSSASDAADDNDGSEEDTIELNSLQETLKSLEQDLAEDPSSTEKWLRLLSHTLSSIPVDSKNATKARSEVAIAVLQRALNAHSRNAYSKILRLKYLKAGEEVWHESKLRAEWKDVLKVGGEEIWLEWLEWRIRKGAKGMDGVIDSALRAFDALRNNVVAELRVFWRVAVALRDAGFSERATAMFQAQAEMTFNMPQILYHQPLDTQIDEIEEFWESEVPRIGEEGAKGWAHWFEAGKPECQIGSLSVSNATLESRDLDPYRQWASEEIQQDRQSRLPTRSTDDSDPYSTVLFGDVRPLLLKLESKQAKHAFRMAWLTFLGLAVPGLSDSLSASRDLNWDDRWNTGYLTNPAYLDAIFPSNVDQRPSIAASSAGVVIGPEKAYAGGSLGPVKSWGYDVVRPLDTPLDGKAGQKGYWDKEDVSGVDEHLARRIFEQLRDKEEDYEWDALMLAFEACLGVKSALKRSKELLSKAPHSLRHWGLHAQLERMRGRLDDARKVYETVLMGSKDNVAGAGNLWWNWAEMEWLAGGSEGALNVVLSSVGVEGGRGGVAMLRAKRGVEEMIGSVRGDWKEREAWIKLRALLELVTGQDVHSAISVFRKYAGEAGSIEHESLTVASVVMVYRYGWTLKNAMAPSILRELASEALEMYGSNSMILAVFLEGEKGQGVWGKVRGMLGASDGKSKTVARRAEEVWIAGWEKGRWMGEVERTRSGLAAAVENERTRGSAVVWRLYLEFELRVGEIGRAKKVLFRAIGECGLVKELYLVGYVGLRGVFSGEELERLADAMAERGIRLRRGLDEVVDAVGGGRRAMEDEEDLDEIEENARELRRLMPY